KTIETTIIDSSMTTKTKHVLHHTHTTQRAHMMITIQTNPTNNRQASPCELPHDRHDHQTNTNTTTNNTTTEMRPHADNTHNHTPSPHTQYDPRTTQRARRQHHPDSLTMHRFVTVYHVKNNNNHCFGSSRY
ncbi:hypothetical protein, partial [Corynebacterium sp. HMSC28B08]|uniref:hypothetical protein n=1 Tax=Corynebacterium sp. HMSC28B08 TaxID=1581066 RepID=UPI001AEFB3BD